MFGWVWKSKVVVGGSKETMTEPGIGNRPVVERLTMLFFPMARAHLNRFARIQAFERERLEVFHLGAVCVHQSFEECADRQTLCVGRSRIRASSLGSIVMVVLSPFLELPAADLTPSTVPRLGESRERAKLMA
jgi:hypothetical protein